MTSWVKLIAPCAVLFVLSIPGLALPPIGGLVEVLVRLKLGREAAEAAGAELVKSLLLEKVELTKIYEIAAKQLELAAIVADYHADAAIQIRARYPPPKEVPKNVEVHIEASDAARQEVRQLQGSVTKDTPKERAAANGDRAAHKGIEAREEHLAAEVASRASFLAKEKLEKQTQKVEQDMDELEKEIQSGKSRKLEKNP